MKTQNRWLRALRAAFPHTVPIMTLIVLGMAVTAAVHLWRRNTLLSIAVGTALYMILVQFVFVCSVFFQIAVLMGGFSYFSPTVANYRKRTRGEQYAIQTTGAADGAAHPSAQRSILCQYRRQNGGSRSSCLLF